VALTTPDGRAHPLIMVGPVAILPERQGQGFGRALMAAQAAAIDPAAPLPQVLIGDAPYYGKFGFAEAPRGWTCPGPWDPARLLVRGASPAMLSATGMLRPWLD
jgi:predicted N-acetyltransferase YhbS